METPTQQHASRGRQKLEEVRRKKAASLASPGNNASSHSDVEALLRRIQNLEGEVQREQQRSADLSAQLQTIESEAELLQRQREESMVQNISDDLTQACLQVSEDEKSVAILRKSLENVTMERDAAFVSREDMVAQLRVARRRLQEAEDEQYKAEEDSAVLRAELKALQHSDQQADSLAASSEQLRSADLKLELQEMALKLQQEQQRVSAERQHVAALTADNQELQNQLIAASAKSSEIEETAQSQSVTLPFTEASRVDTATSTEDLASSSTLFPHEKLKQGRSENELKLRELASMVERQEQGRQKLLAEIDAQSLEIERLFVENEGLRGSLKETTEIAARWEAQVQECLEQNSELRTKLNQLRLEQTSMAAAMVKQSAGISTNQSGGADGGNEGTLELEALRAEKVNLKSDLAKAMARAEELSARVAQLSTDLNRAVQALTSLSSLYKPVLSSIETRLLQLRQDTHLPEALLSGH